MNLLEKKLHILINAYLKNLLIIFQIAIFMLILHRILKILHFDFFKLQTFCNYIKLFFKKAEIILIYSQ